MNFAGRQIVDKVDKMGNIRQKPRARKSKAPGRAVYIECTAPKKQDREKNTLTQNIVKSNSLASFFQRRQACFCLYTFIIIEINVFVNEKSRFIEGFDFLPIYTLRFENGEEIFRHGIVITVPAP